MASRCTAIEVKDLESACEGLVQILGSTFDETGAIRCVTPPDEHRARRWPEAWSELAKGAVKNNNSNMAIVLFWDVLLC